MLTQNKGPVKVLKIELRETSGSFFIWENSSDFGTFEMLTCFRRICLHICCKVRCGQNAFNKRATKLLQKFENKYWLHCKYENPERLQKVFALKKKKLAGMEDLSKEEVEQKVELA